MKNKALNRLNANSSLSNGLETPTTTHTAAPFSAPSTLSINGASTLALPPLVPGQTRTRREPAVMDRPPLPFEEIQEKRKKVKKSKKQKKEEYKPTASYQTQEPRFGWLGDDRGKRNLSS